MSTDEAHEPPTLQITRPFGLTLIYSLVVLVVMLIGLEIAARLHAFDGVAKPSVGARVANLDVQVTRLEAFEAREGAPSCLFIGDSQTNVGIDPATFASAYRQVTGGNAHCFNFGLSGLDQAQFGPIATLAANRIHPHTLVIGINVYDFRQPVDDAALADFYLNPAWSQYYLGKPSLEGWLLDKSKLARSYQGGIRNSEYSFYADGLRYWTEIDANGWRRLEPLPALEPVMPETMVAGTGAIALSEAGLASIQVLDALKAQGYQIVLVEMPLPAAYEELLNARPGIDYQRFLDLLLYLEDIHGYKVILSHDLDLPEDVWWDDYQHLSVKGARVFSEWLAHEFADRGIQP